jgi:hypothetical protein
MLYKEWTSVRTKFLIWLVLYAGVLGWYLVWRHQRLELELNTDPIFLYWMQTSWSVTILVAALGGVDVVAGEKSSGTLSFIMTRPISRTRIYISKIGLNVATLAAVFIPINLVALADDQVQPTRILVIELVSNTMVRWNGIVYQSYDVVQGLELVGFTMLYGITIICLTSLVSIFAPNIMRAIFFTIPVLGIFIWFTSNMVMDTTPNYKDLMITWFGGMNLHNSLLLLLLAASFFGGGLVAFKRKEF